MMGGPRVTSGEDSKQDYGTPQDLLDAIAKRFGPIQFDLAAHAANHKHERYFAPVELVETFDRKKSDPDAIVSSLVVAGGHYDDARSAMDLVLAGNEEKARIKVKNYDPGAYAFNAFAHNWSELQKAIEPDHIGRWLLFLNCEFSDCEPWAIKFHAEAKRGADGVLLTPAALGSNWCRDSILGKADVYELNGRVCFDGKNPFPKDCMVTHFWPGMTGARHLWDWNRNRSLYSWELTKETK